MDDYGRTTNDARLATILAGGQEQSRLAGLSHQQASFGNAANQQMYQNQNTATGANNSLQDQLTNTQLSQFNAANQQRQQALTERFAERNQPINEISGLLSGAQVTNPQWAGSNMPNIPTVDYAGLVQQKYANDVGAYNQKMQGMNNIGSAIGGLFGLSDRRAKKDIKKVGKANGHNVYDFHYKGDDPKSPLRRGLIAQEVRKKQPDAVRKTPQGLLEVNYTKALGSE